MDKSVAILIVVGLHLAVIGYMAKQAFKTLEVAMHRDITWYQNQ